MIPELERARCPLLCDAQDSVVLTASDTLHGLPGEFTVVRCGKCGLLRTDPRPTPAAMAAFYPDDYGPYLGTRIEEGQLLRGSLGKLKDGLRRVVRRVFDSKAQALPNIPPGRMLEIGCASGSFLRQMSQKGWEVEGIEFSPEAAAAASSRGYRVHAGALEDAPAPELPVDLVVGWMVLEHLHNPRWCLRKLWEWSSPGAWLALSVPNARSAEFSLFRENWYALQVPTHLHHFTPETLTLLLQSAGWQVEAVHHQRSVANLLLSMAYLADTRGHSRLARALRTWGWGTGVRSYLTFPIAWTFAVLGQTGRMTVWARKQDTEQPTSGSSQLEGR